MFVRFRQVKAERHASAGDATVTSHRICAGKCKDRPRYHARYGLGMIVEGRTFLKGCPMKPICPLANPRERLEVSIVETHREGGKVKQEHVASLGSIAGDSLEARECFWIECEARLARLANRLGPELDQLRQAIAARIPFLTDDDRAKLDALNWDRVEGWYSWFVERDKRGIARAEEDIRRRQKRIAKYGEPIAAGIKYLRAIGEKYDESEDAQNLSRNFYKFIPD